jgi:hypothetical protein
MKTHHDTAKSSPRPRRARLAIHLTVVLVVKIVLLTLLWQTFIKPYKVRIDTDAMSSRIVGSTPLPASPPSLPTISGERK